MKKWVIGGVLIISLVLFASFILAAEEDETTKINNAYLCLENKINQTGCAGLGHESKYFTLLATGKCKDETISAGSANGTCWPSGSCNVKSTAEAIFALSKAGVDTTNAEKWLLAHNATAIELVWLLQIEGNEEITCKVSTASSSADVVIGLDKKIVSVSSTTCVQKFGGQSGQGYGGDYWLKVDPNCYNQEITISCDKDFLTTLLYKKTIDTSTPIYVSNEPHSGTATEPTRETVTSYCFSTSGTCDGEYEGTLWAATILKKEGYDVSPYMPYLVTASEDNENLIPYSFLYQITNDLEYQTLLLGGQLPEGSWNGYDSNKFYSTAVAMMPFSSSEGGTPKTNAKNWLLKTQDTTGNNAGCWNSGSVRDTAFILYSLWGNFEFHGTGDECNSDVDCSEGEVCVDGVCVYADDECASDSDCSVGESCDDGVCANDMTKDCETNNGYCMPATACVEALGNILEDYGGCGWSICCDKPEILKSCSQAGGVICASGETCSGSWLAGVTESDCCQGECTTQTEEEKCPSDKGKCRIGSCNDDESESTLYTCAGVTSAIDICCIKKTTSGGKSYWWIWVLVILIVIVTVAIIFKDKIRDSWMRMRTKGKGSTAKPVGGLPPRGSPPSRPRSDVNDVLKKLREMK